MNKRKNHINKLILAIMQKKERPLFILKQIKRLPDFDDILRLLNCVKKINYSELKEMFYKSIRPNSYENLYDGVVVKNDNDGLREAVIWEIAIFISFSAEIKKYLVLKEHFEISLMNGQYEDAKNILRDINNAMGFSQWALQNCLLVDHLENNISNLDKIIDINKCNKLTYFLAQYLSMRMDSQYSDQEYEKKLYTRLRGVKDTKARDFYLAKLMGISDFVEYNYTFIIELESSSSLIDRYEMFIDILSSIYATDSSDGCVIKKDLASVSSLIERLYSSTYDYRLYNMIDCKNLSNENPVDERKKTVYNLLEQFNKGNYIYVLSYLKEPHNLANMFFICELHAKCLVLSDTSPDETGYLYGRLVADLYHFFKRLPQTPWYVERLMKQARILLALDVSDGIYALTTKYDNQYSDYYYKKYMYTTFIEKDSINITFPDDQTSTLEAQTYENILEYPAHLLINLELSHLSKDIRTYANYLSTCLNCSEDDLRTLLKQIKIEIPGFLYEKITYETYHYYVANDKFKQATALFVDVFFEDNSLVSRFDVDACYKGVINNKVKQDFIEFPVFVGIISNDNMKKYFAYAEFMSHLNLNYPHEIFSLMNNYERNKFIFFLKHVCLFDVIDSCTIFDNAKQIEDERIIICNFMREIDAENENDYINEISELTRNKSLSKIIEKIDASRIFIDINNIKFTNAKLLIDLFSRIYTITEDEVMYVINLSGDNIKDPFGAPDSFVIYKDNKRFIEFKDFFNVFLNEFAFGQFGLDISLSTRIRHGTLQNHLRIIFEQNNLMCYLESGTEQNYIDQTNYKGLLGALNIDEKTRSIIQTSFKSFSRSVDSYIQKINSTQLKISCLEKNNGGLFDLNFSDEEIQRLYFMCIDIHDIHSVLNIISEALLYRVNTALEKIRDYLTHQAKLDFLEMLNKLEGDILNSTDSVNLKSYINTDIGKCRTEIQNGINTVADWFNLSQNQQFSDFTMEQLTEILAETSKKLYLFHDQIKIIKTIASNSLIKGVYFTYFHDLILILFTNAVKHSKFGDENGLEITMEIFEIDNLLHIVFKNNMHKNHTIDEENFILDRIKELINNYNKYQSLYTKEGGSGYIKLINIIINHFKSQANMSADFIDGIFVLKLDIDISHVRSI